MTFTTGRFVLFFKSGLILAGLGLVFLGGCGEPAPVTAEKSKFQVAGEEDKQPAAGKEDDGKPSIEFPKPSTKPPAAKSPSPSKGNPAGKPGEEPAAPTHPGDVPEDTTA